jgi:hypothetical protein
MEGEGSVEIGSELVVFDSASMSLLTVLNFGEIPNKAQNGYVSSGWIRVKSTTEMDFQVFNGSA